ncbi:hypothetical protein GRZ55_11210 [Chelativorans sp. ZYF759]|uniref:hypothetical protein n=1 Tax=Chelativorans sp. ZYF759 TaxID=2692213 RepID=UPI00145DE212|nr:hypothetical protein [Chelativorans sp. ZYF759]NMG39812.1 hypothetical protein [Chelativorans sp. ZYF759]
MLPARFHVLRDRMIAQVDRIFAGPVRLAYLKDGQVDPERAAVDIEAVFRYGNSANTNMTGGMAQRWSVRFDTAKAILAIDRARYPDVRLRGGDKIRVLSIPGQPWFEVLGVDDRNHTRLFAGLGEA